MRKITTIVAVFTEEEKLNTIQISEGFSIVESIVRAVNLHTGDHEIQELLQTYGPDDTAGLLEFYEDRGIYLSDPMEMAQFKE